MLFLTKNLKEMLIIKNIFEYLSKNQKTNKESCLNLIKNEKITLVEFILNSIENSYTNNEIIENYYSLIPEIKSQMIRNDRKKELKMDEIKQKIYDKEYEFIKEEILKIIEEKNSKKSTNEEFENLHVIITPGHGGRDSYDPGAQRFGHDEKDLNEDLVFEVVKNLLAKNINVYLCNLITAKESNTAKENNEKLDVENPNLHILFKNYDIPAINGFYSEYQKKYAKRIADAHYLFSQAVADVIKKLNPNAKILSLNMHHDACGNENCGEEVEGKEYSCSTFGYGTYYRMEKEDEKENEEAVKKMPAGYSQFIENSKKLGEILVKNCKDVYKLEGKEFKEKVGVFGNDFLITSFGEGNIEASLLVENGYMCNKNQLNKILTTNLMKKLAEKTTNSIVEYYKNIENI